MTTAPYTPYMLSPLNEFLAYIWLAGLIHLVLLIAGILLVTLLTNFSPQKYVTFVKRYTVFNLIFLIVSATMNVVWSYAVWGVAYYSTDYVVDFVPLWPITQKTIDADFGGQTGALLNGFSLRGVQSVWLVIALMTWAITIFIYSKTKALIEKRPSNMSLQEDAVKAPRP